MKISDVIRQLAIIHELQGDLDVYTVNGQWLLPLQQLPWTTNETSAPTPTLCVVFGTLVNPTPVI